jgi:hypothetical protein
MSSVRKKQCICTTWGVDGENHEHNGCPLHAPPPVPDTRVSITNEGPHNIAVDGVILCVGSSGGFYVNPDKRLKVCRVI